MTTKQTLYESKYCKESGLYLGQAQPLNIELEMDYTYAKPIKFGYLDTNYDNEYKNTGIRSQAEIITIQVYRNYGFKIDDKFVIDRKIKYVESIRVNYITDNAHTIKRYVLTLR